MSWQISPPKTSLPCNGELLRFFRSQRGWTQRRLAVESGYSERLIRKAEHGEPLQPDTIEIIAEALSTDLHEVHPEDLVVSAKQLVLEFGKIFFKHGQQTAHNSQHIFSPTVKAWISGDPSLLPVAGFWEGHDGLDRYFHTLAALAESLDEFGQLPKNLYVDGNTIFWEILQTFRPRGSDRTFSIWTMNKFRIERGQITEWQNYIDTAATLELFRESQRLTGEEST